MAMDLQLHNLLQIFFLCLFAKACFCSTSIQPEFKTNLTRPIATSSRFKGMFIFGSSVVDNGNNNDIIDLQAKANYLPYGIDFPDGPTGRFSNGKNVADCISDLLKLPLIPAFSNPLTNGVQIIHGVNFASAGSGILDETGQFLGKVITLNQQISNFEKLILPQLERELTYERAEELLSNYLFLVAAGTNDYQFTYLPLPKEIAPSPQAFAAKLISIYSSQLKKLFSLGARNFLLLSPYPTGCCPCMSKGQGCLKRPNAEIAIFYDQLISMVNLIKHQIPGSEIIVLNSVKAITSTINNHNSTGITNVSDPCCELSTKTTCIRNGRICNNRNSYAFFDGQHYTEAMSNIIASKAYSSLDTSEVYPVNLHQLVNARAAPINYF